MHPLYPRSSFLSQVLRTQVERERQRNKDLESRISDLEKRLEDSQTEFIDKINP